MPSIEDSAQPYRLLKVRNLESSKRDHFRPDPVPFDRPLTDTEREFAGSYDAVKRFVRAVGSGRGAAA